MPDPSPLVDYYLRMGYCMLGTNDLFRIILAGAACGKVGISISTAMPRYLLVRYVRKTVRRYMWYYLERLWKGAKFPKRLFERLRAKSRAGEELGP